MLLLELLPALLVVDGTARAVVVVVVVVVAVVEGVVAGPEVVAEQVRRVWCRLAWALLQLLWSKPPPEAPWGGSRDETETTILTPAF